MSNTIAIIPAKEISERLPNKNILKINDKELWMYSVDYAKSEGFIPVVSTDSEYIISQCNKYGILYYKETVDDSNLCNCITQVLSKYSSVYFAVLQPTSPIRKEGLLRELYNKKPNHSIYTSNKVKLIGHVGNTFNIAYRDQDNNSKFIHQFDGNIILVNTEWYRNNNVLFDNDSEYYDEETLYNLQIDTKGDFNIISKLIQVQQKNVYCKSLGRLGNQMFIAAAAATYAKKINANFKGIVDKAYVSEVFNNVKYVNTPDEYKTYSYIPEYCDEQNIILNDWFQDYRLIDKNVVYDLFKFNDSVKEEIYKLYGDVSDYVSLHVRRGDYLYGYNNMYHVLSKQEIENIVDKYFKTDKILVVSDDIKWCKENLSKDYLYIDKKCKDPVVLDLCIQTMCKSNIISNSTFSWWGAYLNPNKDKKVIYRYPWYNTDEFNNKTNSEYICPSEWIKYT